MQSLLRVTQRFTLLSSVGNRAFRPRSIIMSDKKDFQRIPYYANPENYKILFTPNLSNFTFTGKQTVTLNVKEVTDTIILNANDLKVSDVTFGSLTGAVTHDEKHELVGVGELKMSFTGIHNDLMKGFYRSEYKAPTGELKYNLCTQFESTDARRAFPCIDEPDRKATFDPEVERKPVPTPEGLAELTCGAHYDLVTFSRSPKMSTYLLAMVVGHFDYIESKDANGVKVRVYAPLGKIHAADFALKVACDALPFYSKCFGIPYPLPKMDLIAIPDFAAGAMENWGLVTYREIALLIDTKESSLALRRRVALVVAHELAHMWFGNLVTMKWWTHLWLNEGFATWMEYLCVSKILPEYDIWTQFVESEQSSAFSSDGLKASHPIEIEVKSPTEVDEIFDSISYDKGASIINMLYHYIGDEAFFNGLKSYIAKFQYSNACTEDLWDAFSAASGKPVRDIMSNWTRRMGYPVITVKTENVTSKGLDIILTQNRFLADGSAEGGSPSKWATPVTICDAEDNSKVLSKTLMPVDGTPTEVRLDKNVAFRLNPDRSSFFRVMYDCNLRPGIMKAIEKGMIGPRDRIALLDDIFSLAFSGKQSISSALEFLKAFAGETDYVVWCNISYAIKHVKFLIQEIAFRNFEDSGNIPEVVEKSEPEKNLDKFYQTIAVPAFNKIGWSGNNESNNDTLLRPLIINLLAKCGYEPVVNEALSRFQKHYTQTMKNVNAEKPDDTDILSPDIREAVYACNVRENGEQVYKQLLNMYEVAKMGDEKVRILQTIGLTKSKELRERTIKFTMSPEVRKQDRFRCLHGVSMSGPLGRREIWEFVKSRIDQLPEDMGSQALLGHTIRISSQNFICRKKQKEVKEFFDEHSVPCKRVVEQSLETISINASQVDRDAAGLLKFLASL